MNRNSKKQTKQNGCKVFPDRANCRDRKFSSDPDLFDGCCLYCKDDSDMAKQKGE